MLPLAAFPLQPAISHDNPSLRIIRVELATIREELQRNERRDSLSEDIAAWFEEFQLAFFHQARADLPLEPVLQAAIRSMQALLRCAIPPHPPLDEESVLGSDGRVYGKKSLRVFMNRVEAEYRGRSPLAPQDPTPFSTLPHPLIGAMVRWLARHGSALHSEEIDLAYGEIVRAELAPPPVREELAATLIAGRARRRERQRARAQQQPPPELDLFTREMDEEMTRHRISLERIVQENGADLHIVESRLDNAEETTTRLLSGFRSAIERLERENQDHRDELARLRERLAQTDERIDALERADIQLNIAIRELEQRINKRERSSLNSFCTTLISIGVCILVDYATGGAGSFFGLLPTPGGGKVSLSMTF